MMGLKNRLELLRETVYKGQDAKSMQYLVFHGNYEYSRRNNLLISALSKILTTRLLEVIREDKSSVYYIDANPAVEKIS